MKRFRCPEVILLPYGFRIRVVLEPVSDLNSFWNAADRIIHIKESLNADERAEALCLELQRAMADFSAYIKTRGYRPVRFSETAAAKQV